MTYHACKKKILNLKETVFDNSFRSQRIARELSTLPPISCEYFNASTQGNIVFSSENSECNILTRRHMFELEYLPIFVITAFEKVQ